MAKLDKDEYARLMDSLQVSIGQIQEILLKMADLFRVMLSNELAASTEANMDKLHDMAIGGDENDHKP